MKSVSLGLTGLLKRVLKNGNGLIPAIKAYRVLTGAGPKESKDVVEKYRNMKVTAND